MSFLSKCRKEIEVNPKDSVTQLEYLTGLEEELKNYRFCA
jgi:hypothetical protein